MSKQTVRVEAGKQNPPLTPNIESCSFLHFLVRLMIWHAIGLSSGERTFHLNMRTVMIRLPPEWEKALQDDEFKGKRKMHLFGCEINWKLEKKGSVEAEEAINRALQDGKPAFDDEEMLVLDENGGFLIDIDIEVKPEFYLKHSKPQFLQ